MNYYDEIDTDCDEWCDRHDRRDEYLADKADEDYEDRMCDERG